MRSRQERAERGLRLLVREAELAAGSLGFVDRARVSDCRDVGVLERLVEPGGRGLGGKSGLDRLVEAISEPRRRAMARPATPGRLADLAHPTLGLVHRAVELLGSGSLRWVKWARNIVHPGAFVRDMPPGLDVGEIAFKNAYAVLDAAFTVAADVLDQAFKDGVWS